MRGNNCFPGLGPVPGWDLSCSPWLEGQSLSPAMLDTLREQGLATALTPVGHGKSHLELLYLKPQRQHFKVGLKELETFILHRGNMSSSFKC